MEHLIGRLAHMEQQVNATEDLVNIDLDSRRNHIVALDLAVTSVTLMFTLVTAVTGVFGMNLMNGWEQRPGAFEAVAVSGGAARSAHCRARLTAPACNRTSSCVTRHPHLPLPASPPRHLPLAPAPRRRR